MDDDLKASVLVLVLGVIGLVLLLSIADSQRNTAEVSCDQAQTRAYRKALAAQTDAEREASEWGNTIIARVAQGGTATAAEVAEFQRRQAVVSRRRAALVALVDDQERHPCPALPTPTN